MPPRRPGQEGVPQTVAGRLDRAARCVGGVQDLIGRARWAAHSVGGRSLRLLHSLVADLLTWLDDHPDDQVDPNAVTSIRQSFDWVIERLPAERRPTCFR